VGRSGSACGGDGPFPSVWPFFAPAAAKRHLTRGGYTAHLLKLDVGPLFWTRNKSASWDLRTHAQPRGCTSSDRRIAVEMACLTYSTCTDTYLPNTSPLQPQDLRTQCTASTAEPQQYHLANLDAFRCTSGPWLLVLRSGPFWHNRVKNRWVQTSWDVGAGISNKSPRLLQQASALTLLHNHGKYTHMTRNQSRQGVTTH
jgi:hypothetical protein